MNWSIKNTQKDTPDLMLCIYKKINKQYLQDKSCCFFDKRNVNVLIHLLTLIYEQGLQKMHAFGFLINHLLTSIIALLNEI